jgi:DNA replication protein DnaC
MREVIGALRGERILQSANAATEVRNGGNLFFQLVNARYQREAMILTPNCGFRRSGRNEIFDDPAVATALLDRLLHHQVAEA